MTHPETPNNSIDSLREKELRDAIRGGINIANNALPYLGTRGYGNIVKQIKDRDFPVEAEATAKIALALPNTLSHVRGNESDASVSSKMHGAIGDLIESCENTNLTKQVLINRLVLFCKSNGLLTDGSTAES